ncbi:hypothetical protein [Streptomyces sp. NBC_00996]|uniref:hypothetical protein n=1 Tax=Streptomyces sp. NBC_00996 TaxID=2903710 RepID=UPI00386D4683
MGADHNSRAGRARSRELADAIDACSKCADLAECPHLEEPVLRAADPLVYPALTRDRQAMADLVRYALGPLQAPRDGA